MKRSAFIMFVIIALAGCGGVNSKEKVWPSKESLNEDEISRIKTSQSIGRLIHRKDNYAAWASDILLKRIDSSEMKGFSGWLVHQFTNGYVVSFYADTNPISIIADVFFKKGEEPQLVLKPERTYLKDELVMLNARKIGLQEGWNNCSERFNTVVIGSEDGNWDVYVLAASMNVDDIIVGGHKRITISHDGKTVLSRKAYSKSCLVIDKTPDDIPAGSKPESITVTHIVDDEPAPTHVFLNLLHKTDLFVSTPKRLWKVSEGKISLIDKG